MSAQTPLMPYQMRFLHASNESETMKKNYERICTGFNFFLAEAGGEGQQYPCSLIDSETNQFGSRLFCVCDVERRGQKNQVKPQQWPSWGGRHGSS